MELWFCCKCVVSKHVPLEKVAVNGLVDDEQLLVKDAANYLKKLHPGRSIFANIMVTMVDLTPGEGWNFVFGQASLSEGWGAFSFARFNPNFYKYRESQLTKKQQQEMLRRACRTMVHEVGHILGFKHCIYYHCLMNGSNGDHEVSPFKLCPICLQKLYIAIGTNYKYFDIQKRYENLKTFYIEQQWKKEINWINLRLGITGVEEEMHVVKAKLPLLNDNNNENFQQKYEEACDNEKATCNNNIIGGTGLCGKTQTIKAKSRLIVRTEINKQSDRIGEINAGEYIEIPKPVQIQRTSSGTTRVPLVNGGWVTASTKFGKALIEKYISINNNGISENKETKHNAGKPKNCSLLKKSPETAAGVLANINKMMTSLKATQRSLEATSKKIEENNHAYDLEEKWKEFQETYQGLNERLINNIEQALRTDTKMCKVLNNHK
jgi:predicted Zn-dependent protease